jgi:uncharacterized protein YjbI with pentapeptide repeats
MRRVVNWIVGLRRAFSLSRYGLPVLLVIAVVLIFGYILWRFLEWQGAATTLPPKDLIDSETKAFQTLAQVVGGSFFLITAYFTWRTVANAEKTLAISREGQITERFTKAIEQLGDTESLPKRLGGIYALERIARDSERDHWPIMEVLTAYVRVKARWMEKKGEVEGELPQLPADIQAILSVLGRRVRTYGKGEDHALDLHGTDLRGADLTKAHLEGADLTKAHLEGVNMKGADLSEAHLEGAVFSEEARLKGAVLVRARLRGAVLIRAHLRGADLTKAHLEEANLFRAGLEGARLEGTYLIKARLEEAEFFGSRLEGTHLEQANLTRAILREANFIGTRLDRAILTEAHLEGADLTSTVGLTEEQIKKAITDKAQLPDYLRVLEQ